MDGIDRWGATWIYGAAEQFNVQECGSCGARLRCCRLWLSGQYFKSLKNIPPKSGRGPCPCSEELYCSPYESLMEVSWKWVRTHTRDTNICVTILSFPTLFVSCLTSVSSHRSPERPPPKHSFLFTCCAWFPYSVSACLLWTSFSYMHLPQRGLFPSIAPPKPSFYIYLSSYATNTAWSVHYIVTYLRRPHCMYLP